MNFGLAMIELINVIKFYQGLDHQREALDYLQKSIPANTLEEFARRWRISPPPAPQPNRTAMASQPIVIPVNHNLNLTKDFSSRIIAYMLGLGYKVFTEPGELNIIYVEGCDADGTPNNDAPNHWNDRRIVIGFENKTPKIFLNHTGTSEPGDYYTYRPMNPNGCARIAFGQYKAWGVGLHRGDRNHESLIQNGEVTVTRDLNKDFKRTGDKLFKGYFGINQHHGYNQALVGQASAGCLVGKDVAKHREFMTLVKTDVRYRANKNYQFWTAVIPGDDLAKRFPVR